MDEINNKLINWLLDGDVSIQYQVKRDLLNASKKELETLQGRIPLEGWCKKFLSKRDKKTGLWGGGVYSPKWISTHYTLLELKNLCVPQSNKDYIEGSQILLDKLWINSRGVARNRKQDICVCGMLLSICSYAKMQHSALNEIVNYIISHYMPDGGWNCRWWGGTQKSSLHTTLTVLEFIHDLENNGYKYHIDELKNFKNKAHELLLKRNLYKSLSTGEVIKSQMLVMHYPCRWKYDILRCLDYFQSVDAPYDERMQDAINIIIKKQRKNGRWGISHKHAGLVHFDMEKSGTDSRWNTLRVLRVMKKYNREIF
ncbi:MAG: prenyltransferase/squalene oxidase repeat-containing protein [Ignavibacteriaceae bacterium]|jgi:hypothetical protein